MNYQLNELMRLIYRMCRWIENTYPLESLHIKKPLDEILEFELGIFLLHLAAETDKIYREDIQFLRDYLNSKLGAVQYWDFIVGNDLERRNLEEAPFCSVAMAVRADNLHAKKTGEKPEFSAYLLFLFEQIGEAFLGNRPWVSKSDYLDFYTCMEKLRDYVKDHLEWGEEMNFVEKWKFFHNLFPKNPEKERLEAEYMDEFDVEMLLEDLELDDDEDKFFKELAELLEED